MWRPDNVKEYQAVFRDLTKGFSRKKMHEKVENRQKIKASREAIHWKGFVKQRFKVFICLKIF